MATRNAASQQLARARIIKARGERCEWCKATGYVELHHLIRAVDGGKFEDGNLVLLCVPHHQQADRQSRQIGKEMKENGYPYDFMKRFYNRRTFLNGDSPY